jgi:LruC domain-containing protein
VYAQAYKGAYTSAWYPIEVVKSVSGTITIILQFGDLVINSTASTLNGITITDTDGDGVEDSQDAAPSDPQIAFKQRYPGKNNGKVFTQAFERDWPKYNTNSTDLNDYVVQYYYEEFLNASGKITKILGNFEVVTVIWNRSHLGGLKLRLPSSANVSSFKSERYTYKNVAKDTVTNLTNLTASQLKDDLFIFPQRNASIGCTATGDVLCVTGVNGDAPFENPYYGNDGAAHGAFYPGDISRVTIQFGAPITRDELGAAPYDVFLFYSDGSHYASPATKEIHRVGLGYLWSAADQIPSTAVASGKTQADYNGKDKYLDEWATFQWAILIPQVWKPGHEATTINNTADTGYIKYANWVSTKGQENADWYRDTANMVQDKIYQIQPLPNKHLCLDCTVGTESYDPDTLPTTYANTANVAFVEEVISGGNKLMAYISSSAKSGTARGAVVVIVLLVGAIFVSRIWRNSRNN